MNVRERQRRAEAKYSASPKGKRRNRESAFRKRLKSTYRITPEDHTRLMVFQNSCCAICGRDSVAFDIDHDHETGLVRGLLCRRCNIMIGWAEKMGSRAWKYLGGQNPGRQILPRKD